MGAITRTKSEVRSIVTDDEFGGFRITIPPTAKAWMGSGIVLAVWILVMGLTLLGLSHKPLSGNTEGIKFFLILLMFGLAFVLAAGTNWLRRDTVIIEGKSLILRKEFALFRKERIFELGEVRNLRPAPPMHRDGPRGEARLRSSAVAFDYRTKTFQFGVGLSEGEVMRLIKTIRERFPIRDDWKEAEPLPVVR
jgi:hypothetical protein